MDNIPGSKYVIPTPISNYLTWSASSVGRECNRAIAYEVLNYPKEPSKKQAKYLNEGHTQEKLTLEELRADGIEFTKSSLDGPQSEFTTEVRLKGRPRFYVVAHPDALYQRGAIGWKTISDPPPNTPIEVKGLNHFTWSTIHGIKTTPPRYYVQMQMQIQGSEAKGAIFIIRNKNSGDIKKIWIPRDQETIRANLKRLGMLTSTIIDYRRMPQPSWTPGSKQCKGCFFLRQCLSDHGIAGRETNDEERLPQKVEDVPATIDVNDQAVLKAAIEYCNLRAEIKDLKNDMDQRKTILKNTLKRFNANKMIVGNYFSEITIQELIKPDPVELARLIDAGTLPTVKTTREMFNIKEKQLAVSIESKVKGELE